MKKYRFIATAFLSLCISAFVSAQNPSDPGIILPLDPPDPTDNTFLKDGETRSVDLSHVCVDNAEQKRDKYRFRVSEPLELSFAYSDYLYVKGWGKPLSYKYMALKIEVVDQSDDKVLYSFQPAVYSETQLMVYPERRDTMTLHEGDYTIVFRGGSGADGIVAHTLPSNASPRSSVLPPPACHVTVTLHARFLPDESDPALGVVDSIPVYDCPFAPTDMQFDNHRRNAIFEFTHTNGAGDGSQGNLAVSYYDDFGRLTQTVQKNFRPDKDLVVQHEYDMRSNLVRSWLPAIVGQNEGRPVQADTLTTLCRSTYDGETACYSDFIYDGSPLNLLVERYGPGDAWREHSKALRTDYLTNVQGVDSLDCMLLWMANDGNFSASSYATGSLRVVRLQNEDGSVTFEFKDFDGRTVLSRQVETTDEGKNFFDTYSIYDDLGRLRAVFPPILSDRIRSGSYTDDQIRSAAYLYEYDAGDYLTAKKIPDSDWVYYLYDLDGQLVFSQTGNQRERSEWSFHLADQSGRECLTGVCKNRFDRSRPVLNSRVDCVYTGGTGTLKGYAVNGIFLTEPVVHTANFYDHYHFLETSILPRPQDYAFTASSEFPARHPSARGLLTGTIAARLTDTGIDGYDYCVTYYDERDRPIRIISSNPQKKIENEYIAYNYAGQPVKRQIEYVTKLYKELQNPDEELPGILVGGKTELPDNAVGGGTEFAGISVGEGKPSGGIIRDLTVTKTEIYTYTYDEWGRLLTTTHKNESGEAVTLVDNEYDDLGRLKTNRRNSNPALKTDYTYNIRSWLKSISGPLFSETLYYQDAFYGNASHETEGMMKAIMNTPSFSGNISAVSWNTIDDGSTKRSYTFAYDALSRLLQACYYQNGWKSSDYDTSYAYDKQGNMTSLTRSGRTGEATYGIIDRLSMTYDGNKLVSILDNTIRRGLSPQVDFQIEGPGSIGWEEVAETFTYDHNGNLTKDLTRGILEIRYNLLNLPTKMRISNTAGEATDTYMYSADGAKLRVTRSSPSDTTTTDYTRQGIFENGSLKHKPVDGGYIADNEYHFFITDHLGNNRVVAKADGTVVQTNHYYPYGLTFAEGVQDSHQPFRFGGKEFDSECALNTYDFNARFLIPAYGRFTSLDPLAENDPAISPYLYCAANPLKFIDPTGMDWYSYMKYEYDEDGNITGGHREYEYTEAHSQYTLQKSGINGTYEGNIVVVFNGSMNERLGRNENDPEGLYINGEGAITAQVTVYGPDGPDDIAQYTGFTMSSDYEKYGAIADGKYEVNYVVPGKSGRLSSNYAINNKGPVDCINGVNPSPVDPYSDSQKNKVYIHATNRSGKAGGNVAISTGCLLIQGGDQWEGFKAQIGPRDFRLILNRK